MPDFRIRLEFDVEVDNPSHIDAAFAAAEWLGEVYRAGQMGYLAFDVASQRDLKDGEGTQFKRVDLEDVRTQSDDDESHAALVAYIANDQED